MEKTLVQKDEILIVGLSARTCNANEMSHESAKIPLTADKYLAEGLYDKIPNRKNPGITFGVYTDYESDEHGAYTYLIGEEVTSLEDVPEGLSAIRIPKGKYQKFTTNPGPMPSIVIDAWKIIWDLSEAEMGGKRSYKADYEYYDYRAQNPSKTVLDVFIGVDE